MSRDSYEMVKHCDKCQQFDKAMTNPPEELSLVSVQWPFVQWGVDLVGHFQQEKGGCQFIDTASFLESPIDLLKFENTTDQLYQISST
jgi:hypothetical protein